MAGRSSCANVRLNRDTLECRRFEVAGLAVELRQDVRGSGALRTLGDRHKKPTGAVDDCEDALEAAEQAGEAAGGPMFCLACAAVPSLQSHPGPKATATSLPVALCFSVQRGTCLGWAWPLGKPALRSPTSCCAGRHLAAGTASQSWTWAPAPVRLQPAGTCFRSSARVRSPELQCLLLSTARQRLHGPLLRSTPVPRAVEGTHGIVPPVLLKIHRPLLQA